ncbi:MAG TPA: PaaI family thioesterase [Nitrolancea sp.]|nr:PaaI family thioesterase [Nitrolancea sp.]
MSDGAVDNQRLQEKHSGFFEAQGLSVEDIAPGDVILRLPVVRDDQRGGGGTDALNGGVIAYMFDGALGAAAASLAWDKYGNGDGPPAKFGEVTINLTINYVRPALGDRFEVRAVAVGTGRTVAFAEGKLYDAENRICATASGVWRMFLP